MSRGSGWSLRNQRARATSAYVGLRFRARFRPGEGIPPLKTGWHSCPRTATARLGHPFLDLLANSPRPKPGAAASRRVSQWMTNGMTAWTVVCVLTFFPPLRVKTVSVTLTPTGYT